MFQKFKRMSSSSAAAPPIYTYNSDDDPGELLKFIDGPLVLGTDDGKDCDTDDFFSMYGVKDDESIIDTSNNDPILVSSDIKYVTLKDRVLGGKLWPFVYNIIPRSKDVVIATNDHLSHQTQSRLFPSLNKALMYFKEECTRKDILIRVQRSHGYAKIYCHNPDCNFYAHLALLTTLVRGV